MLSKNFDLRKSHLIIDYLYRTILHDFENVLTFCSIFYNIFCHSICFARPVFGPLPYWLCWFYIYIRNFLTYMAQMTMNFNVTFRVSTIILGFEDNVTNSLHFVFKYIFIVKLNRYTPINEEFWLLFLNVISTIICGINAFLFMTIPGKHGVNFYICLGENIENDPYDFVKVSRKPCSDL